MSGSCLSVRAGLHHVVAGVTGATGLKIIRAIVAGERDPAQLAQHRERQCKNPVETIEVVLRGHYRDEHAFALTQAVRNYDFCHIQVAACDQRIEDLLTRLRSVSAGESARMRIAWLVLPLSPETDRFSQSAGNAVQSRVIGLLVGQSELKGPSWAPRTLPRRIAQVDVASIFLGVAASFLVCLLAIVGLRPVAVAVDLVDKPGGRKTHHGEIPIVGGIAMFLGLSVGLGLVPGDPLRSETFIAACALLVVTGLLDDRFELSPWLRLPAQAAATLMVVTQLFAGTGFGLGNPLGFGNIEFHGLAAFVVILFFVVGAINAFNMLDGMDGLAGAVSLVALSGISVLAFGGGQPFTLQVSLTLAGAVGAFLLFNLPIRRNRGVRCFMGDAGSTLIGFILALLCMRLTQGQTRILAPVSVLWLVALPVFELLWTIIRRVSRRQSPFRADREHFHHLLVDAGLGVRGAFIVYVLCATVLTGAGLLFHEVGLPESLQFALFVLTGIFTVMLMFRVPVLVAHLPPDWHRKPVPRATGDV